MEEEEFGIVHQCHSDLGKATVTLMRTSLKLHRYICKTPYAKGRKREHGHNMPSILAFPFLSLSIQHLFTMMELQEYAPLAIAVSACCNVYIQ